MKIENPKIPNELIECDDLLSMIELCLQDEAALEGVRVSDQSISQMDLRRWEAHGCVFLNCSFSDCDLSRCSFIDVAFSGCNFSNTTLEGSYFSRCSITGSKWVGANFSESILKQVTFQQTNLRYSIFDRSKLTNVAMDGCDLTEASLGEMKWKHFTPTECRFVHTNFFMTSLSGLNFTNSELLAPILSSPPTELRGAKVSLMQAAELLGLFGVVVEV